MSPQSDKTSFLSKCLAVQLPTASQSVRNRVARPLTCKPCRRRVTWNGTAPGRRMRVAIIVCMFRVTTCEPVHQARAVPA